MPKIMQRGLVLLVFLVPLIFSHATTEVYGLIKVVVLEAGVFALLILWLVLRVTTPQASRITIGRTGWAILSFFCVAILSLLKASNIEEGVKFVYQLGAGAGLFFLVVNNVKERKQANEIILAIVSAGLVASLFSLYDNRGIRLSALRFAYTSTFGNPIFFAQYLSLAIPISIAMCLQRRRTGTVPFGDSPFLRVFFGLSCVVMSVFLILSRSRGAFLGVVIAFLYCYIVLWLHSSERIRKVSIGLVAACLVLSLLGFWFLPQGRSLLGENIRPRNLMRVYVWSSVFGMIKEHPVLGVGAGNFKVIYPLYRSPEEKEITPKGIKYTKAHNDFLEIWAEMGVLGLICFLWILCTLAPAILRPLQERKGPSGHISWGLSASLIALLVQSFFNPLLNIPASGMGFWLLLGLIALK